MSGDQDRRTDRSLWNWLLLLPGVIPLLIPFYDRMEPELFGFPFFYWCQLAFVGLAIACMTIVHLATKRRS